MAKAARAIIAENNKFLVMHRNKQGSQYFTLVGGRANGDETLEQCLVREVKEETGMTVTHAQLVYIEEHEAPYNEQHIFLCAVAPHDDIAIQETSEEGALNRVGVNMHQPMWANVNSFEKLPFRTPQLQQAILKAVEKGFPNQPVRL
ncbi:MAG: NUDIX hydrolase [bacterium]|nr:NUDIX hydrolase [bacterium]